MLAIAEDKMRRILVLLSIFISLAGFAFTQSFHTLAPNQISQTRLSTKQQGTQLPIAKGGFRPRLSLQQALNLAESHIKREKINISPYFLSEARIIQYGSEKDTKEQRWYFWWVNENGAMGDYVEITVSMEGKVTRLPSM